MPTLTGTSVRGMQYCGSGLMDEYKEFYFYHNITNPPEVPEQVGIVYLSIIESDGSPFIFFRDRLIKPGREWSLANELLSLPKTVKVWANWNYEGIPWKFYFS